MPLFHGAFLDRARQKGALFSQIPYSTLCLIHLSSATVSDASCGKYTADVQQLL